MSSPTELSASDLQQPECISNAKSKRVLEALASQQVQPQKSDKEELAWTNHECWKVTFDETALKEVNGDLIQRQSTHQIELVQRASSAQLKAQEVLDSPTSVKAGLRERQQKRQLKKFYKIQNELIDSYVTDKANLDEDAEAEAAAKQKADEKQRKIDSFLAMFVLILNIVLLVAKVVAAVLTSSLSVISTVVDSAVDLTSGLIIWITMRAIEHHNPYEYPRGRDRLEPIAVVIIAIIMGIGNILMIVKAVESMIKGPIPTTLDWSFYTIYAVGTAIKVVLMFVCIRYKSSATMVLAADQRNDVITNIVAVSCAVLGNMVWIYADPIGAVLVCGYVAIAWLMMAKDQLPVLSGRTAPNQLINRIINISINHDERIQFIDTIFVYHFGNKFLVELHVVMDAEMSLKESHDISEPLQMKLLRLEDIERVFVHCDYDYDHVDY